jgi:hypothetical protein
MINDKLNQIQCRRFLKRRGIFIIIYKYGFRSFKKTFPGLDHSHNSKAMNRQFKRLASIAMKRGYAVAIGHPLVPTYRMIKEGASKLEAMGIEIVPISRLLRRVEGVENGRGGFQKARELNQ